MEDIQLTESEQRYFSDLFACCDLENTGKIPLSKAAELFKSANLPIGILKQITDICGVGRSNYLERRQFYWTLKLIAAFQAGLPIRPELFQTNLDVPLPRFTRNNSMEKWERCHVNQSAGSPDLIQLSDTDRSLNQVAGRMACNSDAIGRHSPTHNGRALSLSSGQKSRSPEASSTASDSPTPTNSVQERNWAAAAQWHGIVCEEQRQLLGTEEESSDRHSSDDDGDPSEVWTITEEQREYYTAQFLSLQPDPAGLVAGSVARLFFEKSRLPVHELRKIWQLADVTKDGALSIEEFNTAMHLVVLRRNNIDLPDCLPPTLAPPLPASVVQPPVPPQPPIPVTSVPHSTVVPVPEPTTLVPADSPPSPSPSAGGDPDSPLRGSNKDVSKWTKFVDSPTSSVSSPGPKPVNFDFHKSAVEQDPKILHPVALRVTPESQGVSVVAAVASAVVEEEPCRSPRKPSEPQAIPYEQFGGSADSGSPKKVLSTTVTHTDAAPAEIRPIQRPQAKKPAAPGPGAIPPPPQPAVIPTSEDVNSIPGAQSGPTSLPSSQIGPKKEPPPPPPPRPYRTHARSSSLDLNRLGKSGGLLGIPPVVPPRVSPSTTSPNKKQLIGQHSEGDVLSLVSDQTGFADFGRFGQEEEETAEIQMPRKHGAFEVYRKPTARASDAGVGVLPEQDSPQDDSQQQRHQHEPPTSRPSITLRQLQEQNTLLLRVCQELNQELAEVQEERASLEMQLEHLRSHLTD